MEVEAWGMVTAHTETSKKGNGDQVRVSLQNFVAYTPMFCNNLRRLQASRMMQARQHRRRLVPTQRPRSKHKNTSQSHRLRV